MHEICLVFSVFMLFRPGNFVLRHHDLYLQSLKSRLIRCWYQDSLLLQESICIREKLPSNVISTKLWEVGTWLGTTTTTRIGTVDLALPRHRIERNLERQPYSPNNPKQIVVNMYQPQMLTRIEEKKEWYPFDVLVKSMKLVISWRIYYCVCQDRTR